jgi:hypothetical protein
MVNLYLEGHSKTSPSLDTRSAVTKRSDVRTIPPLQPWQENLCPDAASKSFLADTLLCAGAVRKTLGKHSEVKLEGLGMLNLEPAKVGMRRI